MCAAGWTGCQTDRVRDGRRPCGGPIGLRSSRSRSTRPRRGWDHPLVDPAAGRGAGRQSRHHCPRLARVRSQPVRRVWLDRPEQRTHDYTRHGSTTLFAALEVATGRVIDQCAPRHRHQEFLAFLKQVARAYPRRQLHVICDNYATHKHPVVWAWLAKHARIELHFTPTSASWLNLVEVFFSIIERQALRRGDFASVQELVVAIGQFCAGWNQHCQPFTWTKPAGPILAKLNRQPLGDRAPMRRR